MRALELDTPHGPARAHLHPAGDARGALVLGHGAGGGVGAPDLVLAGDARSGATPSGWASPRVEPGDYFAEEQVATWGLEPFWGLPEYPSTPYYRTFETPSTRKRTSSSS